MSNEMTIVDIITDNTITVNTLVDTTTEPLFTVENWTSAVFYSWDVSNDTCAICRYSVNQKCIECVSQELSMISHTEQLCSLAKSRKCSHIYHEHCIKKWLKRNNRCPYCNEVWEFEGERNAVETNTIETNLTADISHPFAQFQGFGRGVNVNTQQEIQQITRQMTRAEFQVTPVNFIPVDYDSSSSSDDDDYIPDDLDSEMETD